MVGDIIVLSLYFSSYPKNIPPQLSLLAPVTELRQLFSFLILKTPRKAKINASLKSTNCLSGRTMFTRRPQRSFTFWIKGSLYAPPSVTNKDEALDVE